MQQKALQEIHDKCQQTALQHEERMIDTYAKAEATAIEHDKRLTRLEGRPNEGGVADKIKELERKLKEQGSQGRQGFLLSGTETLTTDSKIRSMERGLTH